MSDTSSSFPHFFRMLDKSYFLNFLKLECSLKWYWGWLLTVYLILWNLKMNCKSPYKCKSLELILSFFQLGIDLYCEKRLCIQFDHVSEVEANKKW